MASSARFRRSTLTIGSPMMPSSGCSVAWFTRACTRSGAAASSPPSACSAWYLAVQARRAGRRDGQWLLGMGQRAALGQLLDIPCLRALHGGRSGCKAKKPHTRPLCKAHLQ